MEDTKSITKPETNTKRGKNSSIFAQNGLAFGAGQNYPTCTFGSVDNFISLHDNYLCLLVPQPRILAELALAVDDSDGEIIFGKGSPTATNNHRGVWN